VSLLSSQFKDYVWTVEICEGIPYVFGTDLTSLNSVISCGAIIEEGALKKSPV
jgi:hypothetical protein